MYILLFFSSYRAQGKPPWPQDWVIKGCLRKLEVLMLTGRPDFGLPGAPISEAAPGWVLPFITLAWFSGFDFPLIQASFSQAPQVLKNLHGASAYFSCIHPVT